MSRSVSDFAKLYQQRMASVIRQSCAELSTRVIARTPVDSGDLRASWTPNKGEPKAVNVDTASGGSRHDIAAVVNSLEAGDTYSLANGQPYAQRIEYEGHSPQAPSGMVRITIAEFPQIVRSAVNASRS